MQVLKFNGMPVRNLRHLATMVLANQEQFMRFDMEYEEAIILDTAVATAATEEILKAHSIPNIVSSDLMDLLRTPGLNGLASAAAGSSSENGLLVEAG